MYTLLTILIGVGIAFVAPDMIRPRDRATRRFFVFMCRLVGALFILSGVTGLLGLF